MYISPQVWVPCIDFGTIESVKIEAQNKIRKVALGTTVSPTPVCFLLLAVESLRFTLCLSRVSELSSLPVRVQLSARQYRNFRVPFFSYRAERAKIVSYFLKVGVNFLTFFIIFKELILCFLGWKYLLFFTRHVILFFYFL